MRHQRRLAAGLLAVLLLANVASARRPLGLGGIGALGGATVPKPVAWTIAPGRLGAQMSSCQMSEMTGQCKSTMAPVFQSGQPLIESTNYPAMAKAYIAANNWFCSQFSNDTCAWPCQYSLGIGCQIAGHLYYQPWTCPNSLGYAWNHCSQPPQWSSKPSCLSSSMCSWNDAADVQSAKCTSTYACNMTDQQKLFVYGSLYFSTMPRELHGCCKGSTYVYQVDNFCRAAFSNNGTGSATPESCAKVPGCTWDVYNVNGCYPSAQTQVALQFAYKPSDPLAAPLKQLAGECATIKDAAVCNNYKPVKVDPAKISYYVDKHLLLTLNQPVTDAICPLPSMPPPWV